MTRKLLTYLVLSLLVFAFLAFSAFAMGPSEKKNHNQVRVGSVPKAKLAGAERTINYVDPSGTQSLGADDIVSVASPGVSVGTTTYDYQANCRMNRQIGHRGNEMVHIDWMKQVDSTEGGDRGTGYNNWDADEGELGLSLVGCDAHPRLGGGNNYSGYVGLDVDTEGKVNLCNHHDEGAGYAATVWYDFAAGACFFSPYRARVPDSAMQWLYDTYTPSSPDAPPEYIWPSHDYQVLGDDTITHVFACEFEAGIEPSLIAYFRRVGSDTVGEWDYPPMAVDTAAVLGQTVTSSHVSGKVALVWPGNIPEVQGDVVPGQTGAQRNNDLFVWLSEDMGASWPNDVSHRLNVTANADDAGWHLHGDISALYANDDYLHVIWDAREVIPTAGGTYTHFYGCRLFHWSNRPDQATDPIRVIKDANWDLPDQNTCNGGAWNEMSIVKMSVSECDGKMYATFCQFQDPPNGITDDCHEDAFTGGQTSVANGEVYVSVSDNWGFNWDVARNITQTYTPHCQEGVFECESDVWPSAARFGMENVTGDFTGAVVVDIGEDPYAGDDYLDISYINDKYPGGCVQDAGVWTTNAVMWTRIPCVEPVPNPLLSFTPSVIDDPAWTKPSTVLDTIVSLQNIGNAPLDVSTVSYGYVGTQSGWITADVTADINISHLTPNYFDLGVHLGAGVSGNPARVEGYLIFESTSNGGSTDSLYVSLIVADSVQFPVQKDIRTDCKRIIWNNAGNIGDGGNYPDGGYNMDFFEDCDTTDNGGGASNDNIRVYLYESTPFVLRINDAGDTVLNNYMFDADWLSDDGFRPLAGPIADSITFDDYQYGYTGPFGTMDTSITVEVEYFAPTHPDTCSFIVLKQKFYNTSGGDLTGVYVGDLFDWDIPSDTSVRNGSDYDAPGGEASYDLMYCYGGEYSEDSIVNNDCIYADQRMGGMSFYNGFKAPWGIGEDIVEYVDSLENPAGPWWTHINEDWVSPTGGWVGSQLYAKMEGMGSTWETWEATAEGGTNPDSMYQDLNMVSVFGKFDLTPDDTLVFVKILTTTTGGTAGIMDNITKARAWIAGRADIFSWPDRVELDCCDVPGDANNNGTVNILDITYLIAYLYKGGPAPPCLNEGDIQANCAINILDITGLISYLYKGGTAPICGCVE